MSRTGKTVPQKGRALAGTLNFFLNLFWTTVFLGPVAYYMYLHVSVSSQWIILSAFLLPYFLRDNWLDRLAAGRSKAWYERAGVPMLLGYVQQGRLIHRIIRTFYPVYRVVYDKATIRQKIKETYSFERFHYGLLLVMLLLTGHALIYQWRWMPVMIVCNVIFNAYPVLLQQYVRIRLRRML